MAVYMLFYACWPMCCVCLVCTSSASRFDCLAKSQVMVVEVKVEAVLLVAVVVWGGGTVEVVHSSTQQRSFRNASRS